MNGDTADQNGHAVQQNGDVALQNGDVEFGVRKPGGYYSVGANPPPAWSNCKCLKGLGLLYYSVFLFMTMSAKE